MSGMNGISIAAELAESKRDAAAQVLARVRQAWMAAQLQLDQLESYAQECTARWARQSAGCAPEIMRHHYQFMARLDHAIGLQKGVVAEHGRHVEREAAQLREAEARLEGLRQVLSARRLVQARLDDRREQKRTDEQAALLHRRRQASTTTLGGLQ